MAPVASTTTCPFHVVSSSAVLSIDLPWSETFLAVPGFPSPAFVHLTFLVPLAHSLQPIFVVLVVGVVVATAAAAVVEFPVAPMCAL